MDSFLDINGFHLKQAFSANFKKWNGNKMFTDFFENYSQIRDLKMK